MISYPNCSKCGTMQMTSDRCRCCRNGHLICNSCAKLFLMELVTCPLCQAGLISVEEYRRSQPSFDQIVYKAAMRQGWKWTFQWWKFLFRNPLVIVLIFAWFFTLLFLMSVGRNPSIFANILEWVEGTLFISIAPLLTLLYIRKRKTGLGMLDGWKALWRGERSRVWMILGVAGLLFLVRLMLETRAIG